jgi:hypothetical protein
VPDTLDAFPLDAADWKDTDNDGVGDNTDPFPADPNENTDTDGDGIGNNADGNDDHMRSQLQGRETNGADDVETSEAVGAGMNTVSPFDRPSKALKGESGGGAVMVDTSQFKMTRRSHALLLSPHARAAPE